jgi:hypothetical protein
MHKKNLYPAALDFQLKRKKRERRKKKEVGLAGGLGSLTLPDLAAGSCHLAAGTRGLFVCLFFCFIFFFRPWVADPRFVLFFQPWVSQHLTIAVTLPRHLAATYLATSRRPATETHDWVSPAVDLVFS